MVRRVVTGQVEGKSVVLSDSNEAGHAFAAVRGFKTTQIWATSPETVLPHAGGDPVQGQVTVMPALNGTRFMIVQFPPDAVMSAADFDGAAAGAEYAAVLPGLAECFEPNGSGFHVTDSVDYDIVLSGELTLELDDGEQRDLKAGDIVIQNGTRHAWRNKSTQPAVMASVLIGTKRN
ncbi:mannose-6-phosphate isomerase-like protein (cupin superfamily) [Paraburkholderia atlantica]|uniref:cupin domain-containing protein n=1 Tax=Paraburkholderia atlantica TaxID=2654982 RepID=UPI003D2443FC